MDFNFDFTEKRVIITAFFCMAFTIANLITVKVIDLGFLGMETPAGVLIYPLVYILTNVIADVYGEKVAQRTIILGLCVDILFVFMTTLILFLPSPAFFTGDSSLAFVFTQTPRILVASYISYLIGNFVNARITAKLNKGEEYSSVKNLGIIAFSELIDNFIFIGLAFIGVFTVGDILIMIISHWILSLIWSAIAQPFTKLTVKWAEKGKPADI
ncbi:MAG: queuosine precursor transporter [Methanobrevibacter sp.]|uniref:queuosine precursor transporter n=1 Tax=Methanobrevibacter TaxID=2172 RepID=UPI0015B8303E|nr:MULTISPECIES: queuosine precursor transporter [Methanobrevibacter]MCI7428675.1 queuosine precursor transporter [Methanobrevibacter sp.]MDD6777357.1 queuosine precursor transporter [Methanobacteriaceae archaeon]MDY3096716.1 queuosine precursor transporter [Methanobrevibacter sp.]